MMKKTYMQSAETMGTTVELRLVTDDQFLAEKWFAKLWRNISEFEREFSRFKTDSELSKFNEHAGERASISETFEAILKRAKEFSQITDGIFNPFILPALQKSGYVHSMTGTKPGPDYSLRNSEDWRLLEIGNGWARIPANTAIDLGGIGKGYLADKLADLLAEDIPNHCLSFGGDMRIGGVAPSGQWQIEVDSPKKGAGPKVYFTSEGQSYGIATSGAIREKGNRRQKHLIDPRTGISVATQSICTVVAESATAADVLASCILIAGQELAGRLYEKGIITGALLQDETGDHLLLGKGFKNIKDGLALRNSLPIYA